MNDAGVDVSCLPSLRLGQVADGFDNYWGCGDHMRASGKIQDISSANLENLNTLSSPVITLTDPHLRAVREQ